MQKSNTMGISSISRQIIGEPQRNYLWEVKLPSISGGVDPKRIEPLAQDLVFGDYSINTQGQLRIGSLLSFYAGLLTIPTFQIIFIVPNPNILADYLNAWKLLIVGEDGLFSVKSKYQKLLHVNFINTQGEISGTYKLTGCFPTIFPIYNLAYSASKLATVRIVFATDKIEYTDLST